jgi:hypothetical protein
MNLFITLLENVNKSRTSANNVSLKIFFLAMLTVFSQWSEQLYLCLEHIYFEREWNTSINVVENFDCFVVDGFFSFKVPFAL